MPQENRRNKRFASVDWFKIGMELYNNAQVWIPMGHDV